MPRPPRTRKEPNSLLASAAVLTQTRPVPRPKTDGAAAWQRDAWHYYDTIGEFRFGCDWRAAACSRAKLTIIEDGPDGEETLTEGPEVEALAELFGGDAGQGQMLGTVALHYDVPGETYIVGEVVPDDYGPEGSEVDRWSIYSNEELTRDRTTGVWTVDRGDGPRALVDPLVIRLWRSHPKKWVEATSPARAVLPVLRELEGLGKRTAATIDSRLAGAGLLLIPSEMTFTPPPGVELPQGWDQLTAADLLLTVLTEAMTTAIRDRDSAAALAPIIATAPGAVLEFVKHISFSTPFDERVMDMVERDLTRVARGLDIQPEVLLGLGDSNHWSAWQIDEQGLKSAVEPTMEEITAGLTERWLYPAVEALTGDRTKVNRGRRIGFDLTDLRIRPDRTAPAAELHRDLVLSDSARLRETGFDEADVPDEDELRRRLLIRAAQGGTPEVQLAALAALGVVLDVPAALPAADPAPALDPPAPETDPEGERNPPEPPAASGDSAVLACAELLVLRAVERANNRINRRGRRRPIPTDQLDAALVDAWDQAPHVAARLGLDCDPFVAALDLYTRKLLETGEEHTPSVLGRVLHTDVRALSRG